jgi:hypothetical protein
MSVGTARWLGALGLLVGACGGMRASTVPLGGTHEEEPVAKAAPKPALPAVTPIIVSAEDDKSRDVATASHATTDLLKTSDKPAAPSAFQVQPYQAHQIWTRLFDLEFNLKVGPGGSIDMKMLSHQEARFEVLAASAGNIDKLGIEYSVYTSKMSVMGTTQDSPEELAGKRFVVTFSNGKPEVRDASGNKPPKKQLDSVKDDAREPLEIEKSLKEMALLTVKGKGDFSSAGAVALAGGEDEDTKVTAARASLLKLSSGDHGEKTALVDLGYTLTNAVDDTATVEIRVAGSMTVLDAPARYQTSILQGPMELRSREPGGMQGRGTIKVTTSYKY